MKEGESSLDSGTGDKAPEISIEIDGVPVEEAQRREDETLERNYERWLNAQSQARSLIDNGEKLGSNLIEVENAEGKFRLILSQHLAQEPIELLYGVDANCFEYTSLSLYKDPHFAAHLARMYYRDEDGVYHPHILDSRFGLKPIYFIDTDSIKSILAESVLTVAESYTGLKVLDSAVTDLQDKTPLSRRDAVKRIFRITGKTMLGTYLASAPLALSAHLVSFFGADVDSMKWKVSTALDKAGKKIHPETHTVTIVLRNLIMARKAIIAARDVRKEISEKPLISITVGMAHNGIADILENMSEKEILESISFLLKYPHVTYELRDTAVVIPKTWFVNHEEEGYGDWESEHVIDTPLSAVLEK